MPRFFLDEPPRASQVRLEGREARHAVRVFRLRPGDPLTLFDGSGWEYDAVLVAVRGASAEARIRSKRFVDREAPVPLTLAVAVPRGRKMSGIVRSCAELGVVEIVPLATERTVPQFDVAATPEESPRRWEQIAVEASKQSGRNRLTRIAPAATLDRVLEATRGFAVRTFASTDEEAPPAAALFAAGEPRPHSILVLVGPEGDFAPEEMRTMREAGVRPFSLGRSILRVDTAAVAAVAALHTLAAR